MKLYVGGLPYSTSDQELADLFSQAGQVVSATVIIDRATGRSKGFGFVEMSSDDEARRAITQFNGSSLGGRSITVDEAHERRDSGSDRRRSGGYSDRRSGGYNSRDY